MSQNDHTDTTTALPENCRGECCPVCGPTPGRLLTDSLERLRDEIRHEYYRCMSTLESLSIQSNLQTMILHINGTTAVAAAAEAAGSAASGVEIVCSTPWCVYKPTCQLRKISPKGRLACFVNATVKNNDFPVMSTSSAPDPTIVSIHLRPSLASPTHSGIPLPPETAAKLRRRGQLAAFIPVAEKPLSFPKPYYPPTTLLSKEEIHDHFSSNPTVVGIDRQKDGTAHYTRVRFSKCDYGPLQDPYLSPTDTRRHLISECDHNVPRSGHDSEIHHKNSSCYEGVNSTLLRLWFNAAALCSYMRQLDIFWQDLNRKIEVLVQDRQTRELRLAEQEFDLHKSLLQSRIKTVSKISTVLGMQKSTKLENEP
ncbi:hypothetical protein BGZ83_004173 [Gryganskiella cystojenkinii]|nr:hypothetical protein BGZ83_004173 [Gryganskiella cystojenkinii]